MELPPLVPERKSGDERFVYDGQEIDARLIDFWRWSMSDLVNNATRGALAEFIVAKALGIQTPVRIVWDSYDLETDDGLRIEVKSSGYVQSWFQPDYSKIRFSIRATHAWQAESNSFAQEARRQADVYVFAVLAHRDQDTINPLDLTQWVFYVLPTARLNSRSAAAKEISLATLGSYNPIQCRFDELRDAVNNVQGESSCG